MSKIILIRHGETSTNEKGIIHRKGDPAKLTVLGIKQITATAHRLKELGLNVLYSSDEARAVQSAQIIGSLCNIEVQKLEDMEERNWGDFSGKAWPEIKNILDPLTLDERYNFIPPKGESWKNFEERLVTTLKQINKLNHNKVIGIVTHMGSIRAIIPYLLNLPKEESFKYEPLNASVTIFDIEDNEKIKVETIGNTDHLADL